AEPHGNWFRHHVTAWSSDIGVLHVVRDIATFNGVLAFGIGLVSAYVLEPAMLARRGAVVASDAPAMARRPLPTARTAADGPTIASSRGAARCRSRATSAQPKADGMRDIGTATSSSAEEPRRSSLSSPQIRASRTST